MAYQQLPSAEWRGCTLHKKNDGGILILSPTGDVLAESMDNPLQAAATQGRANAVDGSILRKDLIAMSVYSRCKHMWDGSQFAPDAPKRHGRNLNLYEEIIGHMENGDICVDAAYVGWDLYSEGPVFLRKVRDSDHPGINHFNLEGGLFTVEPGGSTVGMYFIPHEWLTSEANMVLLKRWVNGTPAKTIFSDIYTTDKIKEFTKYVADALVEKKALIPFIMHRILTPPGLELGGDPGSRGAELRYGHLPPGPTNLPIRKLIADATILHRNRSRPSGFVYKAPLIEILEYPEELLVLLCAFGRRYKQDALTLRTLLLAMHLWLDIVQDENHQMEPAFAYWSNNAQHVRPVPFVSLAKCLVYFPHWIKWVEFMRLAEFVHPFRFIKKASETDFSNMGRDMVVPDDDIDGTRVEMLMKSVISRCSFIKPSYRISLYPCMLPGTKISPLQRLNACSYPNDIEIALVGLQHISFMGLYSYSRQPTEQNGMHKLSLVIVPKFINHMLLRRLGKPYVDLQRPETGQESRWSAAFPAWRPQPSQPSSTSSALVSEARGMAAPLVLPGPRPIHFNRPEDAPKVDTPIYNDLMRKLSAVPKHVHWAWHKAFEELRVIPEGQRTVERLRGLVRKAEKDENTDLQQLERYLDQVENMRALTHEDLEYTLPLIFGRILGVEPPSIRRLNIWTDIILSKALQNAYRAADTATFILSLCRSAKFDIKGRDALFLPTAKACKAFRDELKNISGKDWIGHWRNF
jgi:hypothetical protein